MNVHGDTLDLMARVLEASSKRHEVISTNLANANVPNFQARVFRFEDAFRDALAEGGVDAARHVEGEVVIDETAPIKADGNSVHMGQEMALMQKNQLAYSLFSSLMSQRLGLLKRAINGQA